MKSDRLRNILSYILLFGGTLALLTLAQVPLSRQHGPTLPAIIASLGLIPPSMLVILLAGPVIIIVVSAVVVEMQWENLDRDRFQPTPDEPILIGQSLTHLLIERHFIRLGTVTYATSLFVPPSPAPIFVSADRQVVALVIISGISPRVGLLLHTYCTDGALLATYYPGGPTIERADFEAWVETAGPEAALEGHQRRVQAFGARHNAVSPVMSLKDHSAWWSAFGARHWPSARTGLQLAAWLLIPLIPMALIAVVVNTDLFDKTVISVLITLCNPVVIGWLLFSIISGRIRFTRHR